MAMRSLGIACSSCVYFEELDEEEVREAKKYGIIDEHCYCHWDIVPVPTYPYRYCHNFRCVCGGDLWLTAYTVMAFHSEDERIRATLVKDFVEKILPKERIIDITSKKSKIDHMGEEEFMSEMVDKMLGNETFKRLIKAKLDEDNG